MEDPGEITLTDRDVAILLYILDGLGGRQQVAELFGVTPERVRMLESKLMSKLRRASGQGRYAPFPYRDPHVIRALHKAPRLPAEWPPEKCP